MLIFWGAVAGLACMFDPGIGILAQTRDLQTLRNTNHITDLTRVRQATNVGQRHEESRVSSQTCYVYGMCRPQLYILTLGTRVDSIQGAH